jgi:hypothetical protein
VWARRTWGALVHYTEAVFLAIENNAAERHAARAVILLRETIAKGWKNTAHMKKDTDLDCLRGRDDFQKLLVELEAKK